MPAAFRCHRTRLCFALLLVAAASQSAAERRTYTTARAGTPPRIDGRIDESEWSSVEWSDGFVQWEPTEGAAPTGDTRFKILYDDANLYLAYHAVDPEPDQVSSVLGRRDDFPGDWVEINIDSYFDHRTAFSFTASLSGTQGDEFISADGDNWDGNWDPVWDHEARRTPDGWAAEVRIPLSQLRYGDREEHVWGIQVQRRVYRHEERSLWQPVPKDEDGWVSKFGELHGIRGIEAQRQVELLPYTVLQGERFEKVSGDPFADGSAGKLSGGLDGKIGVTSDLTLDLTVNPDFGQVEADPSVVNLTAFETFFSERRPFFIEGANIFESRLAPSVAFGTHTTDRIFYSRRIGRSPQRGGGFLESGESGYVDVPEKTSIIGAMKLTGKTKGGVSIGILESVTAREEAEVDVDGARRKATAEPTTNYFVGRVQKDFRRGDTRLGGMVTAVNRDIDDPGVDFLHTGAYVGGMDFFHYFGDRDYYMTMNVVGSHVRGNEEAILRTQRASARFYQRPDNDGQSVDSTRTSLSGHGGSFRVGKSTGRLNFDTGVAWRSPGFELNDMGFLRNADEVNQFAWMGYSLRNPFSIFRRMAFNVNQWLDFEYGGENLYQAANFNTNATFRNNWNYNGSITRENERISTHELRGGPSMRVPGSVSANAELNTDWRRTFAGGIGGAVAFSDDGAGESVNTWTYLAIRPSNAMRIEISPSYSHDQPHLQYVTEVTSGGEPRFVFASLDQKTVDVSLRVDLAVTPDLTIQYYGAPFIAAGRYRAFKRITDARAARYDDRFLEPAIVTFDAADNEYAVDEDGDATEDYTFENPDFNVRDFNSNLVLRWEYSAGSSLFLVWSQSRFGFNPDGSFALGDDLDGLFDVHPHNVFLIKINRWLNL